MCWILHAYCCNISLIYHGLLWNFRGGVLSKKCVGILLIYWGILLVIWHYILENGLVVSALKLFLESFINVMRPLLLGKWVSWTAAPPPLAVRDITFMMKTLQKNNTHYIENIFSQMIGIIVKNCFFIASIRFIV